MNVEFSARAVKHGEIENADKLTKQELREKAQSQLEQACDDDVEIGAIMIVDKNSGDIVYED